MYPINQTLKRDGKPQIPPLTTLFERGSDDAGWVGSIRFIGFIGYTIAWSLEPQRNILRISRGMAHRAENRERGA